MSCAVNVPGTGSFVVVVGGGVFVAVVVDIAVLVDAAVVSPTEPETVCVGGSAGGGVFVICVVDELAVPKEVENLKIKSEILK